jgi:diguanylate cyclase (GGDEF)-like protein
MAAAHRAQATDQARSEALTLVRLATKEHSQLIENTRRLLTSVSHLPAVLSRKAEPCAAALAEYIKLYPYYTNLGVADPDGDIRCSAVALSRHVNIADRSYFRRAAESGDFSVGDYQVGRIAGVPAINFGHPVIDDNGNIQAMVYAAVDLSWLQQLTTMVKVPELSTLTVIDSSGTILSRYPDSERWTGKTMQDAPLVREILHHGSGGTTEQTGLDHVSRLYAFSRLYDSPSGTVYVSVGIPKAVAFARADQALMRSVMVLVFAAALAMAAAWVGSRTFVLRPVKGLASAARRLAVGDLSARTGLAHGGDEMGRLASSFDDMAAALQRVTRALKTLSAGNQTLLRVSEEQTLLDEMCRIVVEVGGYQAAWVGFAEHDDRESIRPVAQAGFDGGMAALTEPLRGVTWAGTEHGRGPAATAVRTGRQCIVHDIPFDTGFAPWRDDAEERRGHASAAAFPLQENGQLVGVLVICSDEPDAFDDREIGVLAEAAADLEFGIAGLRARDAHKLATETITRMAHFDTLTGLPNHGQFVEQLKGELPETLARNQSLALLLLDLDRLREINDAFGFEQGDKVLKEVGARLRSILGQDETVGRMRGDEFGILLPGAGLQRAVQTALRILGEFGKGFTLDGLELDVTAGIGIALAPQHGTEANSLMRCTNVAMQQAKATGEKYAVYSAKDDHNTARHLVLARELRRAIEENQLILHFQPKVGIADRRLLGIEALVRWVHPEIGIMPPDEFIPLAEHTGLIRPLTDWVMEAALRQSYRWREAGFHLPVAVNLSARNLRDSDLINKTERLLATWASEPDCLELEITESTIMIDPDRALAVLTSLKGLGVRLFLDDFGTGYSSLSYLHRLPFSAVKIDKSFVKDMQVIPDSAAIVRSTITLAHEMGIDVIAEGVEDHDTWEGLAAMGCDAAQGYYIGKPMPSGQFDEWLATSSWQAR